VPPKYIPKHKTAAPSADNKSDRRWSFVIALAIITLIAVLEVFLGQ